MSNLVSFPKLYKMDSMGRIRVWEVWADKGDPSYTMKHGLLDGKLQESTTEVKQGKNVGKANETSTSEQAILEAQSLWNKQKDRKGYSTDIPSAKPKMPMLAKKLDKNKVVWPAYTQPKLDGVRCLMTINDDGTITCRSRQNKEWVTLDHIKADVDTTRWIGYTFDGELYNHDLKDDFNTIVSMVKRDKPIEGYNKDLIQYHIYDVCCDLDFKDRLDLLDEFSNDTGPSIKIVQTFKVEDFEEFERHYASFMELGYEGSILRHSLGPYEYNKRSSSLQKYKSFDDDEFEIVGCYQCIGKFSDFIGFRCVTKEGAEFKCMPKGTEADRIQMRKDWYAGKIKTGDILTVRYFGMTTTENPVPRFPVGVIVRKYE